MKTSFLLLLLSIFTLSLKGQTTLKGIISGFDDVKYIEVQYTNDGRFLKDQKIIFTNIDKTGAFSINLQVAKAGLMLMRFEKNNGDAQYLQLYLKPKTTLEIYATFENMRKNVVFKGEMAEENSFFIENGLEELKSLNSPLYLKHFSKDTIPAQCLIKLNKMEQETLQTIETYHHKNNIDKDFFEFAKRNITNYYRYLFVNIAINYYYKQYITRSPTNTFENQRWGKATQKAQQFLLEEPQENDLKSYWYKLLILPNRNLMLPYLLGDTIPKVEISSDGFRRHSHEGEVYLNKIFKGKTLEFFYANYFEGLAYQEPEFLPEMYARFKKKYPKNQYIDYLDPKIQNIQIQNEGDSKELPADIHIIEKADQITTLKDLLKLFKGKVVFIDLWGSWCRPCREEFKHLPDLKKQFEGKEVAFLYIASETTGKNNADKQRIKLWLNTIKYYHLTGYHLLVGDDLYQDIFNIIAEISEHEIKPMPKDMKKVAEAYRDGKGKYGSYPTYMIADKEGNVVIKYAYKPSNKSYLYKQIEDVLKK